MNVHLYLDTLHRHCNKYFLVIVPVSVAVCAQDFSGVATCTREAEQVCQAALLCLFLATVAAALRNVLQCK